MLQGEPAEIVTASDIRNNSTRRDGLAMPLEPANQTVGWVSAATTVVSSAPTPIPRVTQHHVGRDNHVRLRAVNVAASHSPMVAALTQPTFAGALPADLSRPRASSRRRSQAKSCERDQAGTQTARNLPFRRGWRDHCAAASQKSWTMGPMSSRQSLELSRSVCRAAHGSRPGPARPSLGTRGAGMTTG